MLPENIVPYNIITKYNAIIWDRERISAYGIEKALDWSFINRADYSIFSGKIIAYFTEVRHQVDNKTKAMMAKKK